ncbi:MAG: C40 family peptidase [Bacteroidales bacterium]|nr:C40 family peptidase [Bacteroidales bacterium]
MENFICDNVFVPLRSAPSHRSEMLSQILFGEKYSIIEKFGHWARIRTQYDNYTGWVDLNHFQQVSETDDSKGYVLNRPMACKRHDNTRFVLEAGCEIYNPDFKAGTFTLADKTYTAPKDFSESYIICSESIADTALKFINSPYIWGGRIPSGIDCSGFTQLVYKIHGIPIARDSNKQAEAGECISFISEAIPGDLVFFDNERGRISHVGMIISQGLVIHASGRVRIDTIDHQGIYRTDEKRYSHFLRTIRRIKL